jgi:hypothetical protein
MLLAPAADKLVPDSAGNPVTAVLKARLRIGVIVMLAALALPVQPDIQSARLATNDAYGVIAPPALHTPVVLRADTVRPV